MITIHFIEIRAGGEPADHAVQARPGASVMEAAVDAGIDGIAADCGGMLTCATCHVYVTEPWMGKLPAAQEDELEMLEGAAAPLRDGSRLSCQIRLTEALDGLTVELPPIQY